MQEISSRWLAGAKCWWTWSAPLRRESTRGLLAVPVEGVDVYVTSKDVDGKTLAELATRPAARGVFLRRIVRGATATEIPILAGTTLQRGDIVTLVGRTPDVAAGTRMLDYPDR